ncbi:hypothetical protein QYF36_008249 [Acer negundo]|nr:hypothetical protein QYF36_008249 [Acer negundo]
MYEAWLKESSPLKNHLVRQQTEGPRDESGKVVNDGFGRTVDLPRIDMPLSLAIDRDAGTAVVVQRKKKSTVCGLDLNDGNEGQPVTIDDGVKKGRWKGRARAKPCVDSDLVVDSLLGKHLLVDGITIAKKKLKIVVFGNAPHGNSAISTDISAGRFQSTDQSP